MEGKEGWQEVEWKEARKTEITIGSLFDGIGGFPLAGNRCGIKTLWASEIEPFPIKVTKTRFPNMKHLGDIAKINGSEIEPVDIITFGSPCQDLSVAGKRAGLAGERSGLFMEAVRIIKEMRNTYAGTNEPIRPRFAVWENVPGAFSSNKGEDFRAVLEEICRVKDETVVIPGPPKGKWNTVGTIMGNGYSIAWRVLDAQYWGVPQRRRRIFLVADFGGQSAPEILFKRKGLSRYLAESREARKRVATDAERGFRETGPGYWGEGIGCLRAEGENRPSRPSNIIVKTNFKQLNDMECEELLPYCPTTPGDGETKMLCEGSCCGIAYKNYIQEQFEAIAIDSNCQDSRFKLTGQVVPTIPAKAGTGGNNGPMLAVPTVFNEETITSKTNASNPQPGDPCHTLGATGAGRAICIQGSMIGRTDKNGPQVVQKINSTPEGISGTVSSKWAKGTGGPAGDECQNLVCRPLRAQSQHSHREDSDNVILQHYSVRRLTPLECERLQDYPDDWTNIPGQSKVTKEELEFWRDVWFTWDKTQAEDPEKVKPRTDKAILKWLKNPVSDSAQYKALGNSVAVPCPEYVLEGIKEVLEVAHEK